MFIVLPKTQAAVARRALARLEGLPRRATVMHNGSPRPDLTAKLGAALDTTDCIELPKELEKYAGRTVTVAGKDVTLPTLAELKADEAALPETLRAIRQAKRDAALPKNALRQLP